MTWAATNGDELNPLNLFFPLGGREYGFRKDGDFKLSFKTVTERDLILTISLDKQLIALVG